MSRNYSNWLSAYAKYTGFSEAPTEFHFWVGVSTIAGALRRQVWIDQRLFQWTPNFYIVLVGPAGVVTKSTTMRAGMSLLREVPGIHFGPQSMTWQALTTALEEAHVGVPFGEEFLFMSPITCDISELGTFLRPDDYELVDVLTDLWDGQLTIWERKTKTQGTSKLVNPWINVVGCTTPTWIRTHMKEEMIGGGLTSRCIFVYGDIKNNYIAYQSEVVAPEAHLDMRNKLIEDLTHISGLIGEMKLSSDAIEWGTAWYKVHWTQRPEHLASERFDGYIARKQTHIHKLAMVLSAAQSDDLIITAEHLAFADAMMSGVERNMIKVFELIGSVAAGRHIHELASYVRVYKQIDRKTLFTLCMRVMDQKEFSAAVDGAIMADMIELAAANHGVPVYRMKRKAKPKEKDDG